MFKIYLGHCAVWFFALILNIIIAGVRSKAKNTTISLFKVWFSCAVLATFSSIIHWAFFL